MNRVDSIKSELESLRHEASQLEDELYDAEEDAELIEQIQVILFHHGTPEHDTLVGSIQHLVNVYLTMQELGIPLKLSVSQMNAIRDAVRAALEA